VHRNGLSVDVHLRVPGSLAIGVVHPDPPPGADAIPLISVRLGSLKAKSGRAAA
jgi:hypothetical protein